MKLKYIVRVITPKINKKKNTKTMKKEDSWAPIFE
jgi:hypothetical protein